MSEQEPSLAQNLDSIATELRVVLNNSVTFETDVAHGSDKLQRIPDGHYKVVESSINQLRGVAQASSVEVYNQEHQRISPIETNLAVDPVRMEFSDRQRNRVSITVSSGASRVSGTEVSVGRSGRTRFEQIQDDKLLAVRIEPLLIAGKRIGRTCGVELLADPQSRKVWIQFTGSGGSPVSDVSAIESPLLDYDQLDILAQQLWYKAKEVNKK